MIGPLSGAINPSQSGPGSNGNEGVLHILQSSSITRTSSSDCLVSYPEHLLVGGVLPLWRDAVSIFYSYSQLGKLTYGFPLSNWQWTLWLTGCFL